jgi:hypothetical protein
LDTLPSSGESPILRKMFKHDSLTSPAASSGDDRYRIRVWVWVWAFDIPHAGSIFILCSARVRHEGLTRNSEPPAEGGAYQDRLSLMPKNFVSACG